MRIIPGDKMAASLTLALALGKEEDETRVLREGERERERERVSVLCVCVGRIDERRERGGSEGASERPGDSAAAAAAGCEEGLVDQTMTSREEEGKRREREEWSAGRLGGVSEMLADVERWPSMVGSHCVTCRATRPEEREQQQRRSSRRDDESRDD